ILPQGYIRHGMPCRWRRLLLLIQPWWSDIVPQIACAVTVIGLRVAAVHYNWSLPILKVDRNLLPEEKNYTHEQD
ncbi:MAG: hypothetical protein K2G07_07925, partial [Muribaculaceae bacterium]|nr:hypothetical protein [Muribaculaceae bacterium]